MKGKNESKLIRLYLDKEALAEEFEVHSTRVSHS